MVLLTSKPSYTESNQVGTNQREPYDKRLSYQ